MAKNATCFAPKAPQKGPSLFQHGNVVFQAHDVGWIISGFFTLVAIIASFWLINKHLQWYTNKREQRYITRLLLMVPIYASISLASYLFWDNSTPLLLIRDAYEAIILTAFFYLLLTYLSPDPEVQKTIFRKRGLSKEADAELRRRGQPRRKWVFPLGFVRRKPQDGLFFLQLMKWGVLQYSVIRPTTTLAAVILNHIGLYCEQSWSPAWGHVYISTIVSISVTIAMYCLVQLYVCVAAELAPHRPVLKLFSVKAVVFLTFWQAILLSLLSMIGVVKDTPYMTAGDINIGWGAILETLEMSIFAFVHIKAFSYKPYRLHDPNAQRTPRLRSFAHAMDFREIFRELYAGSVYMWHRLRGVETDPLARRIAVLEHVFNVSRAEALRGRHGEVKEPIFEVDKAVEVEVAVDGERQWLGVGDDYGYGLSRRERSETLDVKFERELEKRGYGRSNQDPEANLGQGSTVEHKRRSWCHGAYENTSRSKPHREEPREESSLVPKPRSRPSSRNVEEQEHVYDDHPPPSILKTYRDNRRASTTLPPGAKAPQLPGNVVAQDLSGVPVRDRYPLPLRPVSATIARTDTVLERLFLNRPLRSDGGHTSLSGDASVVPPSSQSHRTHLPLNAAPAILPQSVGARRPVEVATRRPWSPSIKKARELPAEPAVLPMPAQRPQVQFDQSSADFPPSPPPKDTMRSSHRRELAHFEPSSAPADSPSTPAVPAPNGVSDPEHIETAWRAEERSHHTGPLGDVPELRDFQTPTAVSRRPPRPRTSEAAGSGSDVPPKRTSAPVGVAVPMHAFHPKPSRWPRSKGSPRMNGGKPRLPLRPSSSPLNYNPYHLPDARSPPSAPRADKALSRYRHS